MIKELRQLYTDEQNHRIAQALGNKPEPKDLAPRFLIALNERNLEKVGDHLSDNDQSIINKAINEIDGRVYKTLLPAALGSQIICRAFAASRTPLSASCAARIDVDLDAMRAFAAARSSLASFRYASSVYSPADSSADIGNREDELNWQVNKLIELIGGE